MAQNQTKLVIVGYTTQPREDADVYLEQMQSHMMTAAAKSALRLKAATTPHLAELESIFMLNILDDQMQTFSLTANEDRKLIGATVVHQLEVWFPMGCEDLHIAGLNTKLFTTLVQHEHIESCDDMVLTPTFAPEQILDVESIILPRPECEKIPLDLVVRRFDLKMLDDLAFAPGLDAKADALVAAQLVQKLCLFRLVDNGIDLAVKHLMASRTETKVSAPTKKPTKKQKAKV